MGLDDGINDAPARRTPSGKFPEVCGRSKFPENCALSVVNALFLGFYAMSAVNVVFLAFYALYDVNVVFSAESSIRRVLRIFCLSGPLPFRKVQGPRSGFEGMDAKTTVTLFFFVSALGHGLDDSALYVSTLVHYILVLFLVTQLLTAALFLAESV